MTYVPPVVTVSGVTPSGHSSVSLGDPNDNDDGVTYLEPPRQLQTTSNMIGWWRWLSGRTSVFGRRTFPVLRPTCS